MGEAKSCEFGLQTSNLQYLPTALKDNLSSSTFKLTYSNYNTKDGKHSSPYIKTNGDNSVVNQSNNHITIIQCNIGGAPDSRLAKGATLRNYLDFHKPTLVALTETKHSRKGIPDLQGYKHFTLDPFPGSSGGIAFYFKETLSYRVSKVFSSVNNSILWMHLQNHKNSRMIFLYALSMESKLELRIIRRLPFGKS